MLITKRADADISIRIEYFYLEVWREFHLAYVLSRDDMPPSVAFIPTDDEVYERLVQRLGKERLVSQSALPACTVCSGRLIVVGHAHTARRRQVWSTESVYCPLCISQEMLAPKNRSITLL